MNIKELALGWWDGLIFDEQYGYFIKYFEHHISFDSLTYSEIEEIWYKEMQKQAQKSYEDAQIEIRKPSQKQYREFNPELFKAYISKFSDEDKLEALDVLIELVNVSDLTKAEIHLEVECILAAN